ncbi:hypothetical protein EV663_10312 [Rhodovulum bhavnagarense]|uniref:Uncharacterized protein n=2 Tax=Rhodovulum bhavnagarense TaxID=992286 RepID=A0A4R2REB2_9RHOB|nr:hypothetical protein EV663_10312 [Rhodovulum bhavnagarense]
MVMNWKYGGLALGLVFFLAVLLVKPIGVSTQFVILDGILWDMQNPDIVTQTDEGYTSTNAYLAKSGGKYAKSVANPINYSFVFVGAMMLGALISTILRNSVPKGERMVPSIWRANYGGNVLKRWLVAFAGGFIVLYGARLAGGCTSGHMMSGMSQTAVSGYVFALGAFISAFTTALIMFKQEG